LAMVVQEKGSAVAGRCMNGWQSQGNGSGIIIISNMLVAIGYWLSTALTQSIRVERTGDGSFQCSCNEPIFDMVKSKFIHRSYYH